MARKNTEEKEIRVVFQVFENDTKVIDITATGTNGFKETIERLIKTFDE